MKYGNIYYVRSFGGFPRGTDPLYLYAMLLGYLVFRWCLGRLIGLSLSDGRVSDITVTLRPKRLDSELTRSFSILRHYSITLIRDPIGSNLSKIWPVSETPTDGRPLSRK